MARRGKFNLDDGKKARIRAKLKKEEKLKEERVVLVKISIKWKKQKLTRLVTNEIPEANFLNKKNRETKKTKPEIDEERARISENQSDREL